MSSKREQLKNRILNDLLGRFPINPKRVTQSHDDNYHKIFSVLIDEYGINDSTTLGKFYNLYLSKSLNLPLVDSKIELVFTDDPYTKLKPGDTGVVTKYKKTPWGFQLGVNWDNGSTLQLIPNIDKWKVLS